MGKTILFINILKKIVSLQNQFVIVPTMDLTHPADQLIHGCKYEIVIEDEVSNYHKNQTFHYEIPGKFFIVSKKKLINIL